MAPGATGLEVNVAPLICPITSLAAVLAIGEPTPASISTNTKSSPGRFARSVAAVDAEFQINGKVSIGVHAIPMPVATTSTRCTERTIIDVTPASACSPTEGATCAARPTGRGRNVQLAGVTEKSPTYTP